MKMFAKNRNMGVENPPSTLDPANPFLEDLTRAYNDGFSKTGEILGVHGTSIYALEHVITHGRLLPSGIEGGYYPGSIYFYPWTDMVSTAELPSVDTVHSPEAIISEATKYARGKAIEHGLLTHLQLSFDDPKHIGLGVEVGLAYAFENIPIEVSLKRILPEVTSMGIAERLSDIPSVAADLMKNQGILIAINRHALHNFEISLGDVDDDLCIRVNEGLPVRYFCGLLPLGVREREWFDTHITINSTGAFAR